MSLEERFNLIRVTEDGIRYKKKRKHHELIPSNVFKESDLNINNGEGLGIKPEDKKSLAESKGKRLKQSKKEEMGVSKHIERERKMIEDDFEAININNQNKIEEDERIIKASKNKIQAEIKSSLIIENKPDQGNIINLPSNNYYLNKSFPVGSSQSGESEVKKLLNSEYEKVKSSTAKLEENFNKENLTSVLNLLKNYCNKNAKNANKNLKVKVANLFSDDSFNIDSNKYSHKSTLINLEILFFDLLVNKNNLYQSLIELDSANIGNIMLYYFSQICLLKVLNAILPITKGNLEKYSDVLVIKLKNVENLANENKLFALGLFYNLFKENYTKSVKFEKMTRRGKQISNEYDNIIYSDVINTMSRSIEFKSIHCFEFESVQDVFFSNFNFMDTQIKSSNMYHKIIKYANDEAIENNQKKIKISKVKKELTGNHIDIFSKISNLGVFYANTSDLILDFLDN